MKKQALKSVNIPKMLGKLRSEKIPYLTDYYKSSRKKFFIINVWIDITSKTGWRLVEDGKRGHEIRFEDLLYFPDNRFDKKNHIKFKQDMESIKRDEKHESEWGEYLSPQVLKSKEVLLVSIMYKPYGQIERYLLDPKRCWNIKQDRQCKIRLMALRKSDSDPLYIDSEVSEEIIEDITPDEEIIDDITPDDEIIDDEGDPADNISRLLGIDPVEEEEIIDDITPEPVDDPTQADAGLTSEQEEVVSAEMIQGLVQGHMITVESVDEARKSFQEKLDKAKTNRYGRYIGKDRNMYGMVNGLKQIKFDHQVERFNNMMTDAMNSHSGSEVEVDVARSQFNPLKARLDLKASFFNEKGRKRRDRAVLMMALHDELRERFKTMYKAGLMGQGLAGKATASNIDSLFLSFSQLIKDSKSKFADLSSKLDEILRSMTDAQNELLVEGLDYSSVQAMKTYEYENSRGWDAEENIANRLEKMLNDLEGKIGPHPIIEKVREGRLAQLKSRRYTWENHELHLPAELYELARVPKTNSAVSSLEGVCVSTADDFSFEKTEKKTKSYDRYLSVTSPQYPGFEVRVWTSSREEFRGWGRDTAFHRSSTDKVSDATFKAHMKALFFGISIVNQYDPSYTSIKVHYEKGVRAFYMDYGNYTVLSPTDTPTTALHEVMHSLEHREKKVGLVTRMFLSTRVDANNFTKVQRGEWSFKDAMHQDYASKVYGEDSSEVVTMGVQEFVSPERALQLAKNDYPHYLLSHMIVTGKLKDYL